MEHANTTGEYLSTPSNTNSEEALVGSILIEESAFEEPDVQAVKTNDFTIIRYRWLWDIYGALRQKGNAIDPQTVQEELDRNDQLEEFGHFSELTRLVTVVPSAFNAPSYARTVVEMSERRKLKRYARSLSMRADNVQKPLDEFLPLAVDALRAIRHNNTHDLTNYFASLTAVLEKAEEEQHPIIENLLVRGDLTILSGQPGTGKTFLAQDAACGVATGTQAWGHEVPQGAVCYFDNENGLRVWRDRTPGMFRQRGADEMPTDYHVRLMESLSLCRDEDIHRLLNALTVAKPALVIFDTLPRFLGKADICGGADLVKCLETINRVKALGAAVLVLTHPTGTANNPKSAFEAVLGSQHIGALAECVLFINSKRTVKCMKMRSGEIPFPFTFDIIRDDCGSPMVTFQRHSTISPDHKKVAKKHEILSYCEEEGQPVSKNRIHEAVKGDKSRTLRLIDEMLSEGILCNENGGISRGGLGIVNQSS